MAVSHGGKKSQGICRVVAIAVQLRNKSLLLRARSGSLICVRESKTGPGNRNPKTTYDMKPGQYLLTLGHGSVRGKTTGAPQAIRSSIQTLISVKEWLRLLEQALLGPIRRRVQMKVHFFATIVCSSLVLVGATGGARADTIGRYECNVVGNGNTEPIGDRSGHNLTSIQFSCVGVDGLLKGAIYSAINISEWDGTKGTFLLAGGTHRSTGGFAVTQMLEGAGSVVMKDGKPAGTESSGKAVFKFASGTLAAISGKTVKFTSKPIGVGRFELEFAD
ncbi:hypothetical protein [Bradyrhizobium sp. WYCCWR 12699]|uniref:hypothetical protein n=1 Tax=Bradyrhizobium sp. WYCCWR 12699 TaxID=3064203 RepID=UPI0028A3443C|nr:hypothetical protein [Bradyrhizobium sp. WYCCWR 12699]MDT4739245.1 hypothetical protein [Bradyrhizobium sp. WYCCWR 12699]